MTKTNKCRNINQDSRCHLSIIAPNQQLTTAVIANFGQVVKQGKKGQEGIGDIKIHPLITRLVDPEVLKKMGASKVGSDS